MDQHVKTETPDVVMIREPQEAEEPIKVDLKGDKNNSNANIEKWKMSNTPRGKLFGWDWIRMWRDEDDTITEGRSS